MSEEEMNRVTRKAWDALNEKVDRIGTRTSRWAGGLSVISFAILFFMAFGINSLKEIATAVQENRIKLAAPSYTKADDNAVREEDWARYEREQSVKDGMFQKEMDRRQIWIHGQDEFRLQMVEFAAETKAAIKEMKGLVQELKK